jgi:hypothetical protein
MDNSCSHTSDDTVAVLARVQVRIISFAIYPIHIFQILDIVPFCPLKKHATGIERLDEEQRATASLPNFDHNFKQIMVEINK